MICFPCHTNIFFRIVNHLSKMKNNSYLHALPSYYAVLVANQPSEDVCDPDGAQHHCFVLQGHNQIILRLFCLVVVVVSVVVILVVDVSFVVFVFHYINFVV